MVAGPRPWNVLRTRQDRRDLARPDGLNPSLVNLHPLALGSSREGRRKHVTQGMHEVEYRRERREMPALNRPIHRQAVSQERLSRGPEEVPFPGRLMHDRAEFFGAFSAGQDAPDQSLGPPWTGLAIRPCSVASSCVPASVSLPNSRPTGRCGPGRALSPRSSSRSRKQRDMLEAYRDRLHEPHFDRFPRPRLWTPSSDCLASAPTAPRADLKSAPVDRHHRHLRAGTLGRVPGQLSYRVLTCCDTMTCGSQRRSSESARSQGVTAILQFAWGTTERFGSATTSLSIQGEPPAYRDGRVSALVIPLPADLLHGAARPAWV